VKDWDAPEKPDRAVWIEAWFLAGLMVIGVAVALFG
jgi:hypothetical protein